MKEAVRRRMGRPMGGLIVLLCDWHIHEEEVTAGAAILLMAMTTNGESRMRRSGSAHFVG